MPELLISGFDPLLSTTQLQCIRLALLQLPATATGARVTFKSEHCRFSPASIDLSPFCARDYAFHFANRDSSGFDWLSHGGKLAVRISVLVWTNDGSRHAYAGETQFLYLGKETPVELIRERFKKPNINLDMGKGSHVVIEEMDASELDHVNIKNGDFSYTAIDALKAQEKKTITRSWRVPLIPEPDDPQPATLAQLIHEEAAPVKRSWLVARQPVIFGRPHSDNDLELWLYPANDEKLCGLMDMISGKHLCIEFADEGARVSDRSANGSTLNGALMKPDQSYPLRENDRLGILESAAVTLQAVTVSPRVVHLVRLGNGRGEEDYLLLPPNGGQPVEVHGLRLSHHNGGFVAHLHGETVGLQDGDRIAGKIYKVIEA